MGRTATGVVFAAVLIVVIVAVDVLFLRHHGWTRLAVNVGIVAVALAIYFLFVHRT